MDFLISGAHINPIYLAALGFFVGILGGFVGVGGSFIAGPGLFAAGLPMNFVVGTDLAHIVGKSIVATREHFVRGNVDMKLGLLMAGGTIIRTEAGAQAIQYLKRLKMVDVIVSICFIAVLLTISAFMAWEGWVTIKARDKRRQTSNSSTAIPQVTWVSMSPRFSGYYLLAQKRKRRRGDSPVGGFANRIQRIKLWPMMKLAESEIKSVSLWMVLTVGVIGGLFAGFLGGGAGYVRLPLLVYVLGVPTKVAVGTDLFEIIISATYGTLSHAIKGNVDIMIALVMHTGAAVGAQIGVVLTGFFRGPKIRLAFSPLPLIGAALIVYGLVTGQKMK